MDSQAIALRWEALAAQTRRALTGKLRGLWGWTYDDEVFNALRTDRQQALLLLLGRFEELRLWETVRKVTNVYGEGGVGMNFVAWPFLRSTLERRREFSRLLAGHRNNEGGFRERRKEPGPTLHIVMVATAEGEWAAHFDLHNPLFSPLEAWRHIFREGFKKKVPSWHQIGGPIRR